MSCRKDKFENLRMQATGTWEYHRYVGYPFTAPTLPRGNGQIIVIGTDGSFEKRSHDTVTFRGSYTFYEKKDCYGKEKEIFFKTSDANSLEKKLTVNGDTLKFYHSNCLTDGGMVIYLKN